MTTPTDSPPRRELSGKVALVTGGARNIGRAIARALAAGGADVMVNALHAHDDVDQTVRDVEAAGCRAESHIADVTDPDAVAAMVSRDGRSLRPNRCAREQCRDSARAVVHRDVVRRLAAACWR